jgi:hypothetical protein
MTDAAILNGRQLGAAGHHVRVVSAPSGDPAAVRVELTAEGEVLHERLRAAIDQLMAGLCASIAWRDLETARRALVEITQEAIWASAVVPVPPEHGWTAA